MLSCERSTGCRYQPIQLKLYMNIAYGLMMTPIDFGRPWPMTLTYRGQSSSKLDAFLWTLYRLQISTDSIETLHEHSLWSDDDTYWFWSTLTHDLDLQRSKFIFFFFFFFLNHAVSVNVCVGYESGEGTFAVPNPFCTNVQIKSKLDAFLWTLYRLQISTDSIETLHEHSLWSDDDTYWFWSTLTHDLDLQRSKFIKTRCFLVNALQVADLNLFKWIFAWR